MDKNLVFDLDETIGYFEQLIYIMNHTKKTTKNEVFELIDLMPECFRTNLFDIFYYIIRLKIETKIKSVILYSNNNNDLFIDYILSYIHKKLNYKLFDLSISYNHILRKKVNTKSNDNLTIKKNINELILCSNGLLTNESSICFIDDKEHDEMKHPKLYYIKCEPYKYTIPSSIIYKRLSINIKTFEKQRISQSIHTLISKEIIKNIRLFLMINI